MAGFIIFGRLATATSVTRPNRVRSLGLASLPSGEFFPFASGQTAPETDSASRLRLPFTGNRGYMLNEQFAWLTPFSQLD